MSSRHLDYDLDHDVDGLTGKRHHRLVKRVSRHGHGKLHAMSHWPTGCRLVVVVNHWTSCRAFNRATALTGYRIHVSGSSLRGIRSREVGTSDPIVYDTDGEPPR
jgi:hypothetical protein